LQVDRSKDTLYFADANSLKYLDGTLPGDFGERGCGRSGSPMARPARSGPLANRCSGKQHALMHDVRWCVRPRSAMAAGFDPLGLLDPVNSGGFINPKWLSYSEVCSGCAL
jgi:hypothetical protein